MQSKETALPRRKWIFPGFLALAVIVLILALTTSAPQIPRVSATFIGFTNRVGRSEALFAFTNKSPLMVHLIGYSINSPITPCQAQTVPPGGFITFGINAEAIPGPSPFRWRDAPIPIKFHFRRQDTTMEEAREMLDSVLKSVRIKIGGLNPSAGQNEFSVRATVPSDAPPSDKSSTGGRLP